MSQSLRIIVFSAAIALLLILGAVLASAFLVDKYCGTALSYHVCEAPNTASGNSSAAKTSVALHQRPQID
jgi:hypothetical protein